MAELRSPKSLLLSVLLAACAGAPEDSSELQDYFEGNGQKLTSADGLNSEFSRNAVRASGYARSGVLPPERESWSAVARVGGGGIEPADVAPWLDAGDIDEDGQFAPCIRTPCTPTNPNVGRGDRAREGDRVAGAALRLVDTDHAVIWSDAGGHALLIRDDERTIEINPKLIELIEPLPENQVVPSRQKPRPADSPVPAREPAGFAPDELRNHEPPPEQAPQEDSDGCDCGDFFDCEQKKTTSGGAGKNPALAFLGAVAALWWLRRSGRRERGAGFTIGRKLLALLLIPAALLSLSGRAWAQDETAPAPPPPTAQVVVYGFAPDALIAIDGAVVGKGSFSGLVPPGAHLVQVYRPGGPSYDFPITAQAGVVTQVPPPSAPAVWPAAPERPRPPAPVKRTPRWEEGPYVLGQVGFVVPTARPDGFHYELATDEDTGQEREKSGVGYMVGATGGYRLVRWFGMGGLLMYGRAGGQGTVRQIERTSTGGRIEHEGPADFTAQSLRFGPHLRLMAGGNRARFLGGFSVGVVHTWIDLEHPDVFEQNGVLVQRGTFHHDFDGLNQFIGFDMGAEFNPGDHLLLGVAFDLFVDGTGNLSGGDPFGGTALGYFGMSIRLGYHDWAWR
jgi:hypothetical protein